MNDSNEPLSSSSDGESTKKGASLVDALGKFHAGVFLEKCDRQLTSLVKNCNDLERDGELVITIKIKPTGKKGGASDQVEIAHTIKSTMPLQRGKKIEDDTTVTPMHVGVNGTLSEYPERQHELPGLGSKVRPR